MPFIDEIKRRVKGDIRSDALSRRIYSVDASICEVEPTVIVIPRTVQDITETIQIANAFNVSVTARGAATGIAGGCLGKGVIIDCSKYLHRILSINLEERYAICEPGVVQDDLNAQLAPMGYRLGPDTSTGNRATIGGMVSNNSCGAHSLRYGKMVDHVLGVKGFLSDGTAIEFEALSDAKYAEKRTQANREGEIYREIYRIQQEYHLDIKKHFPDIPRRVSGYNLDELIKPQPLNVAKLITGSEGTLMVLSEIKVAIVPKLQCTGLCIFYFNDLIEAFDFTPFLLGFHPIAIELIDEQIIQLGHLSPSMQGKLSWLHEVPKALVVVELEANSPNRLQEALALLVDGLKSQIKGFRYTIMTDAEQMNQVWALRKAGLGLLLSKRTYSRAIAFLEDISIAPIHLAEFMTEFCAYLKSKGKSAGIYGHIGSGCMHIRPYINLKELQELELIKVMMEEIASLLLKYGGALSGEHGDGLIRSWLNTKMFGPRINEAFIALKKTFDPLHLMNPGKIVLPDDPFKELRLSPHTEIKMTPTFLNFDPEGGFELAVDLCNGNGLCRKKEGLMCPSFQVDQDEYHSTRARAQALRGIIHGQLPYENLASVELMDVLDLCIGCKGCKGECPSQVDMAKMKAEVLFHHHQKNGVSVRDSLFGYIGVWQKIFSYAPKIANKMNSSSMMKWVLNKIGITPKRTLPKSTSMTFSKWIESFQQAKGAKRVLLFNDTFNEFNHPSIGKAAVCVLNALGFEVLTLPWQCCGRPLFSKGLLKEAQEYSIKLVRQLLPYAQRGIPMIGLEPSCLFMIRDDYHGLMPSKEWELVKQNCWSFDEFLLSLIEKGEWHLNFIESRKSVKFHTHCHQKALIGTQATKRVLQAIPGVEVHEIISGCCGMAGSFGYEAEHYEFSMQIGELKLLPEVRKSSLETVIVANGTSCRQQISDATERRAYHLAEVLAMQLGVDVSDF